MARRILGEEMHIAGLDQHADGGRRLLQHPGVQRRRALDPEGGPAGGALEAAMGHMAGKSIPKRCPALFQALPLPAQEES